MLALKVLLVLFFVVGVPAAVWLAGRLTVALLVLDLRRELHDVDGRP